MRATFLLWFATTCSVCVCVCVFVCGMRRESCSAFSVVMRVGVGEQCMACVKCICLSVLGTTLRFMHTATHTRTRMHKKCARVY